MVSLQCIQINKSIQVPLTSLLFTEPRKVGNSNSATIFHFSFRYYEVTQAYETATETHHRTFVHEVVHIYGWTDGKINEEIQVYRYFLEEIEELGKKSGVTQKAKTGTSTSHYLYSNHQKLLHSH